MGETSKNIIIGLVTTVGVAAGVAVVAKMIYNNNSANTSPASSVGAGGGASLNQKEQPKGFSGKPVFAKSTNSEDYDDFNVPRVLKRQLGTYWCGYAVVEAMIRMSNQNVEQVDLAGDMFRISQSPYRANVGDLSANEMIDLIKGRGLKVRDLSVAGSYFEQNLEETLNTYGFAIIGRGGHWQIAQAIENPADGNNLLIHDPRVGELDEEQLMVPKRYSLKAFCDAQNRPNDNWNIITLSEENRTIVKDANNKIIYQTDD